MPEVAPVDGELVITKQYASAFFGTSLASTLVARGVDTVVLVGVSTSGCIRATGVDAIQHGFIPLVVRDAVGDRTAQAHEANLFDLQAKYAEVVDERTAMAYRGGGAVNADESRSSRCPRATACRTRGRSCRPRTRSSSSSGRCAPAPGASR